MRHRFPLILACALTGVAGPAVGQVTIDLNALNALPSRGESTAAGPQHRAPAAPRRPGRAASRAPLPVPPSSPGPSEQGAVAVVAPKPPAETPAVSAKPAAPVVATVPPPPPAAGPPAAAKPGAPVVAVVPPPAAVAPPVAKPPPAPAVAAPPSLPAVAPAAPQLAGVAPVAPPTGTAQGRVTFPPGQAVLSVADSQKLAELGKAAAGNDTATVNVQAYAPATPGDPSAARRSSLERALAVRGALMAAGVPSSRIYVRALGADGGVGPADRADITVLGAQLSAAGDAQGKKQ